MDWKRDNIKERYVDSITQEEAHHIAWLASGESDNVEVVSINATSNGNNIPHIEIHYKYYEVTLLEILETKVGIFHNLNTYSGDHYRSCYCQKELFEYYKEIGLH